LIFVPGASLSAGSRGASSALLAPAGSPQDLLIPQESSRLPLQLTGVKKQHFALTEPSTKKPGADGSAPGFWIL